MWPAIVLGVLSAIQTFSAAETSRANANYQASVYSANAAGERQEADLIRRQTEIENRARLREQRLLERGYNEAAGENRSLLSAANVDLTSGSPLALLEGNANRFAADYGEMNYDRELASWVGNRRAQLTDWHADVLDSQASYMRKSAGGVFGSLLTAGLSGAMTGFGSYMMGGMGGAGKAASTASTSKAGSYLYFYNGN